MERRVFSKTTSFHPLFIIKKIKVWNGVILNGTADFFLLDVERNRGRGLCPPVFSPPFLPPFSSKRHRPKTSFLLSWAVASHVLEKLRRHASSGSRGAAVQWLPQPCLSLVFTYKYRGDEGDKREDKWEKRERREEKRGEINKRTKKKKTEENRKSKK